MVGLLTSQIRRIAEFDEELETKATDNGDAGRESQKLFE